jgi:hypothetical protein
MGANGCGGQGFCYFLWVVVRIIEGLVQATGWTCTVAIMGNWFPQERDVVDPVSSNMASWRIIDKQVFSWENHRTRWGIVQQAMELMTPEGICGLPGRKF